MPLDMVAEEARLTDRKLELEDYELELLNQKLSLVNDVIADGHHPVVTFTVFEQDERKEGGRYVEITDTVKRIDTTGRKVILASTRESGLHMTIDFDRIAAVHGELVDYMDEVLE